MSLHPNWVALSQVDIPWKTFVKEAGELSSKPDKIFVNTLNFKGIEARSAYEEVINETRDNTNATKSTPSSDRPKELAKSIRDSSTTRAKVISIAKTVSTNAILKAVEQNDIDFLRDNLNSENVNACDDFGWTPLMSAAYCGHLDIVKLLLKLGVDRKAKDRSGLTAAQLALKKNRLNIVALLRQRQASQAHDCTVMASDKNQLPSNGQTPTRMAPLIMSGDYKQPNVEFYCAICARSFKETSVAEHESSTLHIFNTKPRVCGGAYSIPKRNKGYQMLLNTGWDEESGLGPTGDGLKYPIKTVLKRNRKGFGSGDKDARVTHFHSGDIGAVASVRSMRQRTMKKKDREKLLSREARRERKIRAALS